MRAHVLVLCERLDELARTSGDLDAQTVGYADFSVTYVTPMLDPGSSTRLDDLVARRPNAARVQVEESAWSTGVLEVAEQTPAASLLVLKVGEGIYPEALERLAELAERGGHDLVIGRRVGQPVWGSENSGGPVATILASSSLVRAATDTMEAQQSVDAWVAAWHQALLDAAKAPIGLEAYAVLAPTAKEAAEDLTVESHTAGWDGADLVLEATVSGTAVERGPAFVVRGPGDLEFALETDVQTSGAQARLIGRLDVTRAALGRPLGDGDWTLGVQATAPGTGAWSPLPRASLPSALVAGRPVVPTLRGDRLQLQIGAVRRRYFRADPVDAVIRESVAGVDLTLPVQGLHAAQAQEIHGSLHLGGLKIPAVLSADGRGGATLRAWLSGLAGSYPVAVSFGHKKPLPLGMTLRIDGVGAMTLVPSRPSESTAPVPDREEAQSSALGRVRRAVPGPVIAGLKKMPGLQRWYADRAS